MRERVKAVGDEVAKDEGRKVLVFGDAPSEVHRSLTRWGFQPTGTTLLEIPHKPGAFERGKVKGVIIDARAEGASKALRACRNAQLPVVLYNNGAYTSGEMYAGALYRTYPGPEELRRAVSRLAACPAPSRSIPVPLEPFLDFLLERFGVVFPSRRSREIKEAVRERMTVLRLPAVDVYLELLQRSGSRDREPDYLMGTLTVGETFLYRTPAHYEEVRNRILTDLVIRRGMEPLRALSAGCSTGEEAYCLAALLLDRVPANQVEVIGADVNRRALEVARTGRYPCNNAVRGDLPGWLDKHVKREDDAAVIGPALKGLVSFVYTNLAAWSEGRETGPVGYFDVIFCRNVLLYFEPDVAARILRSLGERLKPGGVLFLGPSETVLGADTDLEVRTGPDCFYLERPDPNAGPRRTLAERYAAGERSTSGPVRVPTLPPRPRDRREAATGKVPLTRPPEAPRSTPPPPPAREFSLPPAPPDDAVVEAAALPSLPPGATPPDMIEAMVREGFRLLDQEDFAGARHRFERAQRADPDAFGPRAGLLFLAANSGEYAEAGEGCRALIAAGATRPELYYLSGLLADLAGNSGTARQEFERALFLDAGCFMARFRLAELASRESRWRDASREARNLLEQLRDLAPGEVVPLSGGMAREAMEALCLGLLKAKGGGER